MGSLSKVEIVQPLDPSSFTWSHLQRCGDSLHHICYEGVSLQNLPNVLSSHKLFLVRPPVFAVAFGRDVAFSISRTKQIVEFLL